MRRIFSVLILAALGAMGTGAAAEPTDEDNPTVLSDSIVVTANRVGLTVEESVWPAVIISSDKLRQQPGLESTLDGEAGLDVRNYNGYGSLATISNWGTFNRHMLLLYNGRVVKDYSLGGFNLADYSGEEIERIEILKGPQSAFYGSDAVGGVINIITPNSLRNSLDLSLTSGSNGLQDYSLNASRRLGQVGVGGYAEYGQSDNGRENAGSERMVLGLRTDFLSNDSRHHMSLGGRYFRDSLGVPGPTPDPSAIPVYGSDESWSLYDHQQDENYSFDFQYRFDDDRLGTAELDLFWEKKNLDYRSLYNYQYSYFSIDSSATPPDTLLNTDSVDVNSRSILNKRSAGICGRYSRQIALMRVAGGIDFLSGSIRGTTDDLSTVTNTVGPFSPYAYSYTVYNYWYGAQDQFDIWSNIIVKANDALSFDLSGRTQTVKGRRTQPSYNLGTVFGPFDNWRFKIGYAYAFRLPTISEQFAEDLYTAGSNDLRPETSRSVVATASFGSANRPLRGSVSGFYQTVDSLIQYQYDPASYFYVPENVNRFRSVGMDISLSAKLAKQLTLDCAGVFQRAKQTLERGSELVDAYYVPDLKWRAALSGKRGLWAYNACVSYTSQRSIILGGERKVLSSVYELGLTVSAAVTPHLTFALTGEDITDEKRPDQFGFTSTDRDYPSPGRRLSLAVRYKPF